MARMAREYATGTLSDRAGTSLRGSSVVRWVGRSPTVPSGREWNGSQSGQGAAELLSPRPAPGKMQGQPACRAGEPSGQGEEPPPEGLGGGYPLSQTDRAVQRARLWAIVWTASQAPLAAKRSEGRWFSPTPLLEVAYGILDLGVAAMVSLPVRATPRPGR